MFAGSICLALLCLLGEQIGPKGGEQTSPLCVGITSAKLSYHIGEPVVLHVRLRNVSRETLAIKRIEKPIPEQGISILLREDGRDFVRYSSGDYGIGNTAHPYVTAAPEHEWSFTVRILYLATSQSRLAFEKAGKVAVKVTYPLHIEGRNLATVESKVLQLAIDEPPANEQEAWQRIREPEVLSFLHRGNGSKEVSDKVAAIYKDYPKTVYRSALWSALVRAYHGSDKWRFTEDGEQRRQLLRIVDLAAVPSEEWSNQLIHIGEPPKRTIGEWVKELSNRSGIAIRAAEELKDISVAVRLPSRIREVMRVLRQETEGAWVAKDGGYFLTCEPPKD